VTIIVTGMSNKLSMEKKTVLQVLFILVMALILLRLPLPSFVPVANEYEALLYKRLMNGTLIVVFSLGMIQFTGLRAWLLPGMKRIRKYAAIWPAFLLILIWFYLTSPSFKEITAGPGLLMFLVLVTFLKASAEELLFRGLCQHWFLRDGNKPRKAIFLSSLLFSLLHIANFFSHGDWVSLANQLIFAFFTGLIFGVIMYTTGNILVPCILHTLVNIPSGLAVFAVKQVEETETTDAVAGPVDGLLSILMFCVVFSPLIITGLYYFFNKRWVPVADSGD